MTEMAELAETLMQSRQTILPKRLLAPGPDAQQRATLFAAAASAPDHRQLLPWRLIEVPATARTALADVFAQALLERDAAALPEELQQARDKAFRAPLLMLVVVDGRRGDPSVNLYERIVSAGCAVQNILLMATAQSFGSALTSGKALKAESLRRLFELGAADHALCFISVGTVHTRKTVRTRPDLTQFVTHLSPSGGVAVGPDQSARNSA